ncbi:MAG TPA: SAM-dependent methyltransferase, partial [Candidatus Limnocylindria bacterium]|nr:SAM-dependent methyltransferase [Candidatus Limnocylindria bacterium]
MITRPLRRGLSLPMVADVAERVLIAAAGRIRVGHLTVTLPDGRSRGFGDAASDIQGEIVIHDREAMVRLLIDGETGAGEGYMEGQ